MLIARSVLTNLGQTGPQCDARHSGRWTDGVLIKTEKSWKYQITMGDAAELEFVGNVLLDVTSHFQ